MPKLTKLAVRMNKQIHLLNDHITKVATPGLVIQEPKDGSMYETNGRRVVTLPSVISWETPLTEDTFHVYLDYLEVTDVYKINYTDFIARANLPITLKGSYTAGTPGQFKDFHTLLAYGQFLSSLYPVQTINLLKVCNFSIYYGPE